MGYSSGIAFIPDGSLAISTVNALQATLDAFSTYNDLNAVTVASRIIQSQANILNIYIQSHP